MLIQTPVLPGQASGTGNFLTGLTAGTDGTLLFSHKSGASPATIWVRNDGGQFQQLLGVGDMLGNGVISTIDGFELVAPGQVNFLATIADPLTSAILNTGIYRVSFDFPSITGFIFDTDNCGTANWHTNCGVSNWDDVSGVDRGDLPGLFDDATITNLDVVIDQQAVTLKLTNGNRIPRHTTELDAGL